MGNTTKKELRAGIYDPYLDTLGGGERYCLTVAEILLKQGYTVDLFWSGNKEVIAKAKDRFSLDLDDMNLVSDIFSSPANLTDIADNPEIIRMLLANPTHRKMASLWQRFKTTSKYDLFFYLSDGSLPFLFSKKNLLHLQVPFNYLPNQWQKVSNYLKLKLINKVICNSRFTSRFISKLLSKKPSVLYPPVDVDRFSPSPVKENIILSVGRFDNILNAKRQDILIDIFKELITKNSLPGWKLVLAGGSHQKSQDNKYLNLLIDQAKGYPIEFLVDPPFADLVNLYSKSKIYWHAAGFGVDENQEPQKTEHFGIVAVEAMASGCVPVVINKGGLPEIINPGINGYLWSDFPQAIESTMKLINDRGLLEKLSHRALGDSKKFSKSNFESDLLSILQNK
ncbi:MAG: glycosyltransferase family 4 protein [Candidatus Shapirobacteria bacterium]